MIMVAFMAPAYLMERVSVATRATEACNDRNALLSFAGTSQSNQAGNGVGCRAAGMAAPRSGRPAAAANVCGAGFHPALPDFIRYQGKMNRASRFEPPERRGRQRQSCARGGRGRNPFRVNVAGGTETQRSSCLATLGYGFGIPLGFWRRRFAIWGSPSAGLAHPPTAAIHARGRSHPSGSLRESVCCMPPHARLWGARRLAHLDHVETSTPVAIRLVRRRGFVSVRHGTTRVGQSQR